MYMAKKRIRPWNKAETATASRIAKRYAGVVNRFASPDIRTAEMFVEVETEATLRSGLEKLKQYSGRAYLAVTNQEALPTALRLVTNTSSGVMDSKGNIVKEAT